MLLSNRLDVAHEQKIPAARDAQDKLGEVLETLEDISQIDSRFSPPIGRILEAIFQIDGIILDELPRRTPRRNH